MELMLNIWQGRSASVRNKEVIATEEMRKARNYSMELWDIYDKNKQRTGRTMERNNWCLKDDEYHLTVLGVVARKDGKFLITKRVMTKAWAPGWWEVSGGAAMAGEDSAEAVKREVLEETGLDVTGWEGGYLFSYKRENPGEGDNYFVDIYRFVGDFQEQDLHLQQEETAGYMLATAQEIKALADQGVFLHYDSIKQVFEDI
jgi:8-oxo-dGTP pyrophosphatase MutT (NUDIX family)